MYSTPQWALAFAAHCRSRLKFADALPPLPEDAYARAMARRSPTLHRAMGAWHAACWTHRRQRGTA